MAIYYSPLEDGFFIKTSENKSAVIPPDCFEITNEQYNTLLDAQSVGKYFIYSAEKGFEIKNYTALPLTWDDIRHTRDQLLAKSDWTQLPDVPETLKAKWAVYRQQLRDIPTTFATPDLVLWPDTPA